MFYSKYGLIFFKYGLPSFIIIITLGFKLFRYIYNKASKNDKLRQLMNRIPIKPLYRRRLIIGLAHLSILMFAFVSSFSSGTTRADLNITPLLEASVDQDFTDLSSLRDNWPVSMYSEAPTRAKFKQVLTTKSVNNYGDITFTLCKDRASARIIYNSQLETADSENYVQESCNNEDTRYFLTRIYGGRNFEHGTFPLINPILDDSFGYCNLVVQKNNLVIEVNCPYHSPQTDKCVVLDTPLFRIMNITKVANPSADVLIQEAADRLFEIPTE
ncbi:MAG: hypothetical protein CVU90_02100 [Firmicutes bacterium HGW-Firmicutes-15]|nr:MAG: hypothetical protein CVU90_02100 [Firmicutes bacterium HGW-Firmicutes-15]